jgi:unspecific monooxygenase
VTAAQQRTWERHTLRAIDDACRRHGNTFTIHRRDRAPRVYVGEPETIRRVFIENGHRLSAIGSSVFNALVGVRSLGVLNGPEHRRYRRLLSPALHGDRLRSRFPAIHRITVECTTDALSAGSVPVEGLLRRITDRVMLLCCFGAVPDDGALLQAFDAAVESTKALAAEPGPRARAHERAIARLDLAITDEYERRRAAPGDDCDPCVLSDLLSEPGVGDRAIRDQLVTLMVAGRESTPAIVAETLYWIQRLPQVRARLLEELDGAAVQDLDATPFLDAVLAETLRVASVVPAGVTRRVAEGFATCGHDFAGDVEVVPCIHAVHRTSTLYPDPEAFVPERFLDHRFGAAEYLPYGIGSRRCLGAALASAEVKIVVATLLQMPGLGIRLRGSRRSDPHTAGPTVATPDLVELFPRSSGWQTTR